jgi:uncharacterized protein (DUF1501 family)
MRQDWWSCDGLGHAEIAGTASPFELQRTNLATRRSVLLTAAMGLATYLGRKSALAHVSLDSQKTDDSVLVFLFLRGGADGLNMVVPYAEPEYYKARPNLAIAAPRDAKFPERARGVDIDGFFAFHPALAPIAPIYQQGHMSIVHAVGSNDQTRSHFQAMNTVERGAPQDHVGPVSGWLARHLLSKVGSESPLRAVSFSETMPDSLRGATRALAMQSLTDFHLEGDPHFEHGLTKMYGGNDLISHAGQQTLSALQALRSLDPKSYKPSNGASYPKSDLGEALKQVACLTRADLGLEVACLDRGGWDTHVTQGSDIGWQAIQLSDVAASLAAFHQDMGPEMKRITLVMMSEFGRRVGENAGLGTDHGRGGPVFLIGGGLRKDKVQGIWPGVAPDRLDEVGDLRVTTDYRSVLSEVLEKRLDTKAVGEVFPGFEPSPLNLFT